MKKNLVLLGMMGVGKSTLGKNVAKRQDLAFIDTDLNIEKKNSSKVISFQIGSYSLIRSNLLNFNVTF